MTDETVTMERRLRLRLYLSAAAAATVGDRICRVAEYRHWRS